MLRRVFVGALLAVLPAITVWASDTVWSKIVTDDGQHIGYTYRTVEIINDQKVTTNYSQMKVREQESKTRVYVSTTQLFRGRDTDRIDRITRNSGYRGYRKDLTFQRDGDMATITRQAGDRSVSKTIALTDDVAIDNGASRIKNWSFETGGALKFDNLNLSAMMIESVVIEPPPRQNPQDHILSLVRKSYDGEQLRTIAQFDIDKNTGATLTYEMDLLSRKILYVQTDKEDAKSGTRSFSVIRSSMIPSPHILPRSALKTNIRYRFSYKDDIRFDMPSSGEQKVVQAGNFLALDICQSCGAPEPLSQEQLAPYLSPSTWIESDDPDIVKLAGKIKDNNLSDHDAMIQLGRFTRNRIRNVDFMGHYSASDAMDRRKGDCGEDALLLAALGRAAGIPTRVASGLAYSRSEYHGQSNVFLPHIWAQAYINGRWVSYDISLGGFDASFIMTSVGHGDPRSISTSTQLAKRLKWEDMVHVNPEEK